MPWSCLNLLKFSFLTFRWAAELWGCGMGWVGLHRFLGCFPPFWDSHLDSVGFSEGSLPARHILHSVTDHFTPTPKAPPAPPQIPKFPAQNKLSSGSFLCPALHPQTSSQDSRQAWLWLLLLTNKSQTLERLKRHQIKNPAPGNQLQTRYRSSRKPGFLSWPASSKQL